MPETFRFARLRQDSFAVLETSYGLPTLVPFHDCTMVLCSHRERVRKVRNKNPLLLDVFKSDCESGDRKRSPGHYSSAAGALAPFAGAEFSLPN